MTPDLKTPVVEPTIPYIGQCKATEKLYKLEEKRSAAIKAAALELGKVLGHTPEEFWSRTMPETIASILDTYTTSLSVPAAAAYLKRYGFTVTRVVGSDNP